MSEAHNRGREPLSGGPDTYEELEFQAVDRDLEPVTAAASEPMTAAESESMTAAEGEADAAQTGAIRDEIAETRVEMSGTLDAIGQKLDPGYLVSQAKENVREATIGRVEEAVSTASDRARGLGEEMIDTIKRNPLAAALAGIGLAWLWKSRSSAASGGSGHPRYG